MVAEGNTLGDMSTAAFRPERAHQQSSGLPFQGEKVVVRTLPRALPLATMAQAFSLVWPMALAAVTKTAAKRHKTRKRIRRRLIDQPHDTSPCIYSARTCHCHGHHRAAAAHDSDSHASSTKGSGPANPMREQFEGNRHGNLRESCLQIYSWTGIHYSMRTRARTMQNDRWS